MLHLAKNLSLEEVNWTVNSFRAAEYPCLPTSTSDRWMTAAVGVGLKHWVPLSVVIPMPLSPVIPSTPLVPASESEEFSCFWARGFLLFSLYVSITQSLSGAHMFCTFHYSKVNSSSAAAASKVGRCWWRDLTAAAWISSGRLEPDCSGGGYKRVMQWSWELTNSHPCSSLPLLGAPHRHSAHPALLSHPLRLHCVWDVLHVYDTHLCKIQPFGLLKCKNIINA